MIVVNEKPAVKPVGQLIDSALTSGIRFAWKNNKLRIGGPSKQRDLTAELRQRRDELEPRFRPGPGDVVCLGKFYTYPYFVWSGEQLKGQLAFDCETDGLFVGSTPPNLIMSSASDGEQHCVVMAADTAQFFQQHADAIVVGHNFANFDFWVLMHHFAGDLELQAILWAMADSGRIKDTMLNHSLYQLAKRDAFPKNVSLDHLANYYAQLEIDKADPCRVRYGMVANMPQGRIPRMFFDYCVADAVATFEVQCELHKRMHAVVADYGIDPAVTRKYGMLTERIQVQGTIALAAIEHNGLAIDHERTDDIRNGLEAYRDELVTWLDAESPDLLVKKDGQLQLTAKGAIRKSNKVLLAILEAIAEQLGDDLDPPRTKTGQITTSASFWSEFDSWPLIKNWLALESVNKSMQFFANFHGDRIHPRYSPLVRTGRTSSYRPNIQQLPKKSGIREGVVASPGHSLYVSDLDQIELRTYSVVAEQRYGFSDMGNVIRNGIDPHSNTTAKVLRMSLEDFESTEQSDPDFYEEKRAGIGKASNFGFLGGLGARTFCKFAKPYGADYTIDEAQQLRDTYTSEVYKDVGLYLSEDTFSIVARQLGCKPQDVRGHFKNAMHLGCMRRIISGETCKSGTSERYPDARFDSVWNGLAEINHNPDLAEAIGNRDADAGLVHRIFGSPVQTLTGRVRGRVSFTAARNTPFQGLAADAAKLIMYNLTRAGYRIVAFVHDEFIIELPDTADWINEPKRINAIICNTASEVCHGFPIAAGGARMKRWYKKAKAVYGPDGELLIWEPGEAKKVTHEVAEDGPKLETMPVVELPKQSKPRKTKQRSRGVIKPPRIIHGDCIQAGQQLYEQGERFELVFGDPPFNIGHGYAVYDDNVSADQFRTFMVNWLNVGKSLCPDGILAVHGPDEIRWITERLLGWPLHHILWYFGFGQSGKIASARKCTKAFENLIVYGAEDSTFNVPLQISLRAKINDKRVRGKSPFKVANDVWGIEENDGPNWGRVQGNNKERWTTKTGAPCDHPNQMPEKYCQRIIETFSNPGDRVLIMFGGSGSETVVGHAIGRDITTIEMGEVNCESIQKRLQRGTVNIDRCRI